jgi:hypothetical protein
MSKMKFLVLPFCMSVPLTQVLRSSTWGSGISARSAMYGPTGASVSPIFPAPHWVVWNWKSRALMSFTMV